MSMMVCPQCKGTGKVSTHIAYADKHGKLRFKRRRVACPTCGGIGTVSTQEFGETPHFKSSSFGCK